MKLSSIDWLATILVVLGGLNWGLVGLFEFNLVTTLLGEGTTLTTVVYSLVGLSALYMLYTTVRENM